jgi:hypothetical protein
MKQRLLVLFSIVAGVIQTQAQYNVTFRVNMAGVTPSANGVSVAGDFLSFVGQADFNPGDNVLVQEGASTIYSTTLNLPEGIFQYKFFNGNTLNDGETVPTASTYPGTEYRYTPVFSDTTIEAFLFSGSAPAGKELLEFSVNLQFFTPNDLGVFVAGDFQTAAGFPSNWTPGITRMIDFMPFDVEQIYTIQTWVPSGTYLFKYTNGPTWGNVETVPPACGIGTDLNRQVTVTQGVPQEVVLCFSTCDELCVSVSTGEVVETGFVLMPNPANESAILRFNQPNAKFNVVMTDMTGRRVMAANNQVQQMIIERNELPAGIYILQIENEGNVSTSKLIFN